MQQASKQDNENGQMLKSAQNQQQTGVKQTVINNFILQSFSSLSINSLEVLILKYVINVTDHVSDQCAHYLGNSMEGG